MVTNRLADLFRSCIFDLFFAHRIQSFAVVLLHFFVSRRAKANYFFKLVGEVLHAAVTRFPGYFRKGQLVSFTRSMRCRMTYFSIVVPSTAENKLLR